MAASGNEHTEVPATSAPTPTASATPSDATPPVEDAAALHRRLAVDLFNAAWDLIDLDPVGAVPRSSNERNASTTDEMTTESTVGSGGATGHGADDDARSGSGDRAGDANGDAVGDGAREGADPRNASASPALSGRTPEQTDAMLHAAHASRWHWAQAGAGPKELAIGEWQCSHVHALAGHADAARYHARRNLEICQQHGIGDFVLAFAHEALARAAAVAGDAVALKDHLTHARDAGEQIEKPEDREWFFACLAGLDRE